jgi:DNA-binding MarR family transcriptional regulator
VIDDRLGWALAQRGRAAGGLIMRACVASGLKPPHLDALMLLSRNGAVSQQGLIEAMDVDPSVLVTLLNDLERDGLALRRRDPHDRRRHIVELTVGGGERLAAIDRAVEEYEHELFAALSEAELALLRGLLGRLNTIENGCAGTESDTC